jgi:two-component system LytT family response regulator
MERYHYIIIDDDYPSHLSLNHHFKPYPKYKCLATFSNPEKALLYVQDNEIDLIFLDIEMPLMSGFQFLDALQKEVFVVILTAFENKYGLEAHHYYDKDLVFFSNKAQLSYYLPKIIARFEKMYKEKRDLNRMKLFAKNEILTFPKKIDEQSILLEDIIYIEIIGHHIILYMTNNDEIVFRMTARQLLSFLPSHIFFQIKRNLIINIEYVTAFTESTVCFGGQHHVISVRNRQIIIPKLILQKQKSQDYYSS